MKITITGQVKKIMPVKETANFKSIDLVVTTDFDSQYPQHHLCQITQGKTSQMEGINEGDLVKCEVNLNGREWQDPNTLITKYFNSIDVWKINKQ
jgi:hypothetical protein